MLAATVSFTPLAISCSIFFSTLFMSRSFFDDIVDVIADGDFVATGQNILFAYIPDDSLLPLLCHCVWYKS
jgi:hypothetical protein